MGSSTESWCVLTALHSAMAGSRQPHHGCKELCKSSRCCFPLQSGLCRLSSRCLLFLVLLHAACPEYVHRKGTNHSPSAARRRSGCLQPHTVGKHGRSSQHTSTLPHSSPIQLIRTWDHSDHISQTFPSPIPVFLSTSSLGRDSMSVQGLLLWCPSSG